MVSSESDKSMPNLLAISGSARAASSNTALLKQLARLAPAGVDIAVFAALDSLPVFNPDHEAEQTPELLLELCAKIAAADGLIISSPEYIRAIPGGAQKSHRLAGVAPGNCRETRRAVACIASWSGCTDFTAAGFGHCQPSIQCGHFHAASAYR